MIRHAGPPGAKPDPYAAGAHRTFDVVLVVLTAVLMFIVFRTGGKTHANQNATDTARPAQSQQVSK